MSDVHARAILSDAVADDATEELLIPVPQDGKDYVLVYSLWGTFVGTVQAQDNQSGSFAAVDSVAVASGGAVAGHPTAVGNFAAAVTSGAEYARLVFSAHTSGEAEVDAILLPVSA